MRATKFRAWDKIFKFYVGEDELYLGITFDGKFLIYKDEITDEVEFSKIDDYIIEQYTGLKDKNGKEIYEGDIVKVSKRVGSEVISHITEVSWSDRYAQFWTDYLDNLSDEITEDFFEVIGNIHENPELLEGEDA